VEELRE
jgi:tricorn protease-like protein